MRLAASIVTHRIKTTIGVATTDHRPEVLIEQNPVHICLGPVGLLGLVAQKAGEFAGDIFGAIERY